MTLFANLFGAFEQMEPPMIRIIPFVFALIFAYPVAAAQVEIDMNTILRTPLGDPVEDCDKINETDPTKCDVKVPMTLGRLSAAAVDQIEQGIKPDEITSRGTLARKIRKALASAKPAGSAAMLSLYDDDVKLIKAQLAKLKIAPSLIVQADMLLDGEKP